MSIRVVGLDLSITATGIAWVDGTTYVVKSRSTGDRRLLDIVDEVATAVEGRNVDLVVIEDLPTHAKAAGITGMVHGAVRTWLIREGIPYALVTPASLKKYATGAGNAGKPQMAVAAFKRLGRELSDDNQVDALWLRAAGLDYLGDPPAVMPAAQREALNKVAWPQAVLADA
jgi:Holliday junction resolvasome RuvABC endonuclease subunit